jgi:hypothetical protein
VVFADHATTGDGMLTAIALLDVVQRSGHPLSRLAADAMTQLPQVLVNVRVSQRRADIAELIAAEIAAAEAELGTTGRVLIRPSGTEPLIRVMVEAPTSRARRCHRRIPGGGDPLRVPLTAPIARAVHLCDGSMTGSLGLHVRHHRSALPSVDPGGARAGRDPRAPRSGDRARRRSAGRCRCCRRWPTGRCAVCRACWRWPTVTSCSPRSPPGSIVSTLAIDAYDADLESTEHDPDELERRGAASIALRDVLWSLRHDRLRTARDVAALAGRGAGEGAVAGYLAIQQSLSAIDRLEVRGRDSAGIHVYVHDHALDLGDPTVIAAIAERGLDPTYPSGSVRVDGGVLSFVYKAAAEIGELGDNTRALRARRRRRPAPPGARRPDDARTAVLGHTRWASVGIISEPNTHPLNSDEVEQSPSMSCGPYVVAALNGDVDNHADLRVEHQLRIHQQITTDAKVIPALVSRHAAAGPTSSSRSGERSRRSRVRSRSVR